jgi:hypothetical protein
MTNRERDIAAEYLRQALNLVADIHPGQFIGEGAPQKVPMVSSSALISIAASLIDIRESIAVLARTAHKDRPPTAQ